MNYLIQKKQKNKKFLAILNDSQIFFFFFEQKFIYGEFFFAEIFEIRQKKSPKITDLKFEMKEKKDPLRCNVRKKCRKKKRIIIQTCKIFTIKGFQRRKLPTDFNSIIKVITFYYLNVYLL